MQDYLARLDKQPVHILDPHQRSFKLLFVVMRSYHVPSRSLITTAPPAILLLGRNRRLDVSFSLNLELWWGSDDGMSDDMDIHRAGNLSACGIIFSGNTLVCLTTTEAWGLLDDTTPLRWAMSVGLFVDLPVFMESMCPQLLLTSWSAHFCEPGADERSKREWWQVSWAIGTGCSSSHYILTLCVSCKPNSDSR